MSSADAAHSRPAAAPARHAGPPADGDEELAEAIRETLAPWERGEVSSRDLLRALRRLADDFG